MTAVDDRAADGGGAAPEAPRGLRRAFRWAAGAATAACVLVGLDAGLGLQLPGAVRPALPWVLVGALVVALALGVGAWGKPEAPARADGAPPSPGRAPQSPR